ncbi:CYTH domain protein [Roseimaritima ulvae]|uniref:CYTH domain protein n=2 Tax=Roseimaritima ulvae TaxID=980254 RepID=A0A5B9QXJ5_9BACT|nr:CYTH domain protein [Roseimaritima ulvae]
MYEVELKFAVAEPGKLRQRVLDLGGTAVGVVEQHCDTYYAHPCRDFKQTTEALRIRSVDGHYHITYKGPKRAGVVKTRQELEWSLGADDPDGENMSTLLVSLGFQPVATVTKHRETLELHRQGQDLKVTFDEVAGVGSYSEIEAIAEQESQIAAAREAILQFAEELGLTAPEPRSYLNLLLNCQKK